MAITISGENNNDRILASDGVIDQISGINIVGLITASHINVGSNINLGNAGIITATTFVGNVTGNVNSTSPLLLQTGGSERFRITGNNELGIAGANYGTSGQVLTSGGSGSAVSWTTIPTQVTISNNSNYRIITGGSGTNLNGESTLNYSSGHQLIFSGSANPLSGTSIPYSVNIYRDGGSGYGYFDTMTNSSYSTGVRIRTYNNTTYNNVIEHTTSKVTNFQTNGLTRLSITSGGQVNIGTGELTQTARKLNVYGGATRVTQTSSGNTVEVFGHTTSGQSYGLLVNAGSTSGDYCANFRNSSGTTLFRIRGDGNVGIGTDNPSSGKLQVQDGGIAVRGAATPNINFSPTDGNSGNGDISFDGSDLKIISNSSSANVRIGAYSKLTHFVIRPNGRIGMGTDNPSNSSLLHLYSTTFDPFLRVGGGTRDCGITLQPNNAFNALRSDASNRLFVNAGADSIRFSVGGDSSTYEKLRITSSGRFGLNRSAPHYAMHLSPADGETRIDLHMTNDTTGHNSSDGVQFGYQNSAGAYIWNFEGTDIYFGTNNSARLYIRASTGHLEPHGDNSQNLGSSSARWANIYTGDLQLSNKGKTNDVDGTWGDWTLQEGESDVYMINNRSGKKFKIIMEEVE